MKILIEKNLLYKKINVDINRKKFILYNNQ